MTSTWQGESLPTLTSYDQCHWDLNRVYHYPYACKMSDPKIVSLSLKKIQSKDFSGLTRALNPLPLDQEITG
jgi:hypothetical protein